jgi:NitT/TauT family transport system permease protein
MAMRNDTSVAEGPAVSRAAATGPEGAAGEGRPTAPRSGMRHWLGARLRGAKGFGYTCVSLAFVVALWWLVVLVFGLPEYVLPTPAAVFDRIIETWTGQLFSATLVTGKETLIGFVVAIAVAVPLAVLITYSKIAERFLYPMMVSSQVVPKVAIAPLFVVWFGFGLTPKVLIAFLIAFFPIVIDTTVGLRSVDPGMIHLARSMGASEMQTFRKVRLPNGLPSFFGGLKVAVTLAVIGAVVGEFVGSSNGLGYVLITATGNVDTPLVFGSIIMMSLIGIVLFALLEMIERVATPWHRSRRDEAAGPRTATA